MLDLFLHTREMVKRAQVPMPGSAAPQIQQPQEDPKQRALRMAGGKPTLRQYGRWGAIAGGAGISAHVLNNLIEGAGTTKTWLPKFDRAGLLGPAGNKIVRGGLEKNVILHPRSLARAAAIGMLFSTAVPAARKLWDIRTAEKTPEKF
jgi:hypothetical protein